MEISSDSEDEAMNEGNGNLIDSSNNNPGEKLDPSLESAIWEATQKLVELSNGSSISINVSELNASSSILCSNVISHFADSCLEGYLVDEMVINEENNDRTDESFKIVDSLTLPSVTATETNIDNNNDHDDVGSSKMKLELES